MNLSEHFTLDELCASATADKFGIDNTPNPTIIGNLQVTAEGLEKVRALLGYPLHVNSGYRCLQLNSAVDGAAHSAHMDGFAADFVSSRFGTPVDIAKAIAGSTIPFDKCIQEGNWVHISFAPTMRRLTYTAHFDGSAPTYTRGICS